MFWVIFFSLLLLMVVYLLLMPIVLCIDTIKNLYYIQLWGLAKASLQGDEEELIQVRFKVFFMDFSFYPLRKFDSKKGKRSKEVQVKEKRKRMSFRTGWRLLKTFKVKRFLLNIDTGNCISNAKLYPLFAFLNYRMGGFNINFQGRNQLVLHIQNRPIRIIGAFINF